jgi:hypothetical protein
MQGIGLKSKSCSFSEQPSVWLWGLKPYQICTNFAKDGCSTTFLDLSQTGNKYKFGCAWQCAGGIDRLISNWPGKWYILTSWA